MVSLYKRLLRYQETEERSNLENYSTEILCDLLNRLTKEESLLFIREVIFSDIEISYYKDFISNHSRIKGSPSFVWMTQYSINISGSIKYPDLVATINNKIVIIIEVKIDAAFTHRLHQDKDGNTVKIPQLVDYGNWLHSNNKNGVLVLLSHLTPPPLDFLKSEGKYGINKKSYITWGKIYKWLKIINNSSENCLVADLKKYLLEFNMAVESPKREDFSIIEILISGSGERIGNMMSFIRSELEKKYTKNMSWGKEKSYLNDEQYTFAHDQRILWSWVVLDTSKYSYIAWGVCFPDETDVWGWRQSFPTLPKEPYIFIGLFSGNTDIIDDLKKNIKIAPRTWEWDKDTQENTSDLIGVCYTPLHKFNSFENDITEDMYNFVNSGFEEINDFLNTIVFKS